MGVIILDQIFEGAYTNSSHLKDQSGVYAVLKETSKDNYQIIYVGESEKVKSRIENNHEHTNCWNNNNFTHFAVLYVPEDKRLAIETKIRQECKPTCNRQ